MSRYTSNMLREDIIQHNAELKDHDIEVAYRYGGRNGYTAIDLQEGSTIGTSTVTRGLSTGTPRECLDAMTDHKNALLLDYWKSVALERETMIKKNNLRITILQQERDELKEGFKEKSARVAVLKDQYQTAIKTIGDLKSDLASGQ